MSLQQKIADHRRRFLASKSLLAVGNEPKPSRPSSVQHDATASPGDSLFSTPVPKVHPKHMVNGHQQRVQLKSVDSSEQQPIHEDTDPAQSASSPSPRRPHPGGRSPRNSTELQNSRSRIKLLASKLEFTSTTMLDDLRVERDRLRQHLEHARSTV